MGFGNYDVWVKASRATTLATLKASHTQLTHAAIARMEARLDWYHALPVPVRSALGLVVRAAVASFTAWFANPTAPVRGAHEVFAAAPPELARSISLQQTLQITRVVVEVVEERAGEIAAPGTQRDFTAAVLRYSREVAFSAAEVYARSAELRGAWDARLEAFIIDALIRGEIDTAFHSRLAALGWTWSGPTLAVVGKLGTSLEDVKVSGLRRGVRRLQRDALVGIHIDAIIVILGGDGDLEADATGLLDLFSPGPVIFSDFAATLDDMPTHLDCALDALRAAPGWPQVSRPGRVDDLLPERVFAGDLAARERLIQRCLLPLVEVGGPLLPTVSTYLEDAVSLEAAARKLGVHPNTVRYRLKRVGEITGCDPLTARDAFVLHTALVVGRLERAAGRVRLPAL